MSDASSDPRLYPTRPILSASVAVFRDGRALVARRARAPLMGLYSLPGGVVELGETLSAVDFYLVMLARWARPMRNPPRARPHIAKLLDKVTALPSVRRAYAGEGINDEIC